IIQTPSCLLTCETMSNNQSFSLQLAHRGLGLGELGQLVAMQPYHYTPEGQSGDSCDGELHIVRVCVFGVVWRALSKTEARALTRLPSLSNPLGNLVFTRDQQITTSKGIVMANMHPKQR